jgi:hypothetical protein
MLFSFVIGDTFMARPLCPKCENNKFQVSQIQAKDGNFLLVAIHCAACGAVVGVKEAVNAGATSEKTNEAIKLIARHLGVHVNL